MWIIQDILRILINCLNNLKWWSFHGEIFHQEITMLWKILISYQKENNLHTTVYSETLKLGNKKTTLYLMLGFYQIALPISFKINLWNVNTMYIVYSIWYHNLSLTVASLFHSFIGPTVDLVLIWWLIILHKGVSKFNNTDYWSL